MCGPTIMRGTLLPEVASAVVFSWALALIEFNPPSSPQFVLIGLGFIISQDCTVRVGLAIETHA